MSKRGLPLVWASGPPRVKFWSRFSWSQLRLVSSSSSVPPVRSTLVASGLDAHSASGSVPTPQTPLSPARSSCIPGISVFLSGDIPIIGPIKSKRSGEKEKRRLLISSSKDKTKKGTFKKKITIKKGRFQSNLKAKFAVWNNSKWHFGRMCSSKRWPCFLKFPWGHTPCCCRPLLQFMALSLPLSSIPAEDQEALSPPPPPPLDSTWGPSRTSSQVSELT